MLTVAGDDRRRRGRRRHRRRRDDRRRPRARRSSSGNLKALVVRVDSPGGSVTASERIRRAILAAKARGIPVVISMGSVAASRRLLDRDRRRHRSSPSPRRSPARSACSASCRASRARCRSSASAPTGSGRRRCRASPTCCAAPRPRPTGCCRWASRAPIAASSPWSRGRGELPPARVDEIGQGRVWDGGTARQLGLVDRFGSLDDAIAEAARRAKIDPGRGARRSISSTSPASSSRMLQRRRRRARTAGAARDAFARLGRAGPRRC